jgi:hypothetical protein
MVVLALLGSDQLVDRVNIPQEAVDLDSFRRWMESDAFPDEGRRRRHKPRLHYRSKLQLAQEMLQQVGVRLLLGWFILVPTQERGNARPAALRRESRDAERPHARSHAGAWERENHPSKRCTLPYRSTSIPPALDRIPTVH